MDLYLYIISILGGFLAGVLNAIAGFGSVITLAIMIEMLGLPPNIANGTNRVNVFAQTSMSSLAYYRKGKLRLKGRKLALVFIFIGSILGVILAINISNAAFKEVFKYLLLVMFLVILVNPKRWIIKTDLNYKTSKWISIPVFLILGFYGGFIQMGMGVFTLIFLVLVARINSIEANAIKVFVVAVYNLVLIFIFHSKGLIDWKVGLLFAVSQGIGGYIAAHIASIHPKAEIYVYRTLLIIILLALIKAFG